MTRRGKRGNRKNAVTNVRVVDDYAGANSAKVDRMLAQLQNSQSQTRVEVNSAFDIRTVATGGDVLGTYTIKNVRLSDEFDSLSSQWNMFRVRAIRFDIYDVNPNLPLLSAFSTVHETSFTATTATYSFQQVVDGPDAQIPTCGGPRARLTWVASGIREMEFQNFDGNADNSQDFGGLRYAIGNATAGLKFSVLVKAIVDVRGRF